MAARVRPVTPSPVRLAPYRRIERRRGLPLVARLVLAMAVLTMGGAIVWVGSGGVGPFLDSVVRGFGGFMGQVGQAVSSTPPTPTPAPADAPSIVPPEHPYTNAEAVDVTVNVPSAVTGLPGYSVRLWVTLPDADPAVLTEVPVGATSMLRIPGVELAKGRNDLQASIVGPGGETEWSAVVTFVRDTSKPKLSVISPADGAQVTKEQVTVKGKTQAGSSVRLRNEANGATATTQAGSDGLWEARIALAEGGNRISIVATDPAGNPNSLVLEVRRGSGRVLVELTASAYRFKASRLPTSVTFNVSVTGPDGARLRGATALFVITVPGLQPFVSEEKVTDSRGQASYSIIIPSGAHKGDGPALVEITTQDGTKVFAKQVLRIE